MMVMGNLATEMGKRFVTFVEVIHQLVIYVTLLERRACHKVSCVSTDRQRTHCNQLDSRFSSSLPNVRNKTLIITI